MSDGELRVGTALFLRSFKDHPSDSLMLSFPAPKQKGRYHLAIWLGTWAEGEAGATERLNAMGWHYDPDKAAKAMEARQGQDPQGLDGDSHDSAVGNADLPNTPHAPEKE